MLPGVTVMVVMLLVVDLAGVAVMVVMVLVLVDLAGVTVMVLVLLVVDCCDGDGGGAAGSRPCRRDGDGGDGAAGSRLL